MEMMIPDSKMANNDATKSPEIGLGNSALVFKHNAGLNKYVLQSLLRRPRSLIFSSSKLTSALAMKYLL